MDESTDDDWIIVWWQGYTEAEFIRFVQEIFTANSNGTPDKVLDKFCELAEHPDGTDLIYWPENETRGK